MTNSRDKGKRGEREFARTLTTLGYPAERGQQFRGGQDSPDVKCDSLPQVHWEVKFYADSKMNSPSELEKWRAQAEADGGDRLPVIAHRWNGSRVWWCAVCRPGKPLLWMLLPDFLETRAEWVKP